MINDETLKNIENLHRLKTEGVLTEEEFETAKEKLLNGLTRARSTARPIEPSTPAEPSGLPDRDDFFGWALLPLKRYADFTGRSTRKEHWLFVLVTVLAMLGAAILGAVDDYGDVGTTSMALIAIIWLATFIPTIAVQVRRFHDQDKSGWLALLNFIPYIGWLIVIVLMAQPGTEGENKYGPDPLA